MVEIDMTSSSVLLECEAQRGGGQKQVAGKDSVVKSLLAGRAVSFYLTLWVSRTHRRVSSGSSDPGGFGLLGRSAITIRTVVGTRHTVDHLEGRFSFGER